MMAAAEARAVWQRAVNRCFVQEDAKRAPKLACCQSSSSASTKQLDSGFSGAPDPQDQSSVCFMPLNRNHRFPDLSPDTRWWVHMQPGYANQKELMKDQMMPLEAEINIPGEVSVRLPAKDDSDFHPDSDQGSASRKKRNHGIGEREVKTFTCENFQEYIDLMETIESCGFVGSDNVGYESSKKSNELSFDLGQPWNLSSEKVEPWWRTTDKDELASLVAQKSLDYIENCDLPTPQKMQKWRHSYGSPRCFDCDGLSSLDRDSQAGYISNSTINDLGRHRASTRDGHEQYGSEKSFSCSHNTSSCKDRTQTPSHASSESGLSKAELLEALRHSQTRAREAEKAAKEAYEEKEHLVKILFKQASQLFAYKQWFQLLQLEALYLQIKKKSNNDDRPIQKLPWMHCKARKPRRKWNNDNRGKRAKPNPDVTKYAVAFALGLSLVGAGLLVGWTVGWMLPF